MRRSLLPVADLLPAQASATESNTSATAPYVATFGALMEQRLSENRHKGDAEGWRKETVGTHIGLALKHLKDMETELLHTGKHEEMRRQAADCANRLMMACDVLENGRTE
jgi:hypothetical protein